MQRFIAQPSRLATAIALASAGLLTDIPTALADSAQLEEVVVNARRNDESVQSVPIAIAAISGEALAESKVENGSSLQKIVPSLTIYSQSRDEETFSIRGLSGSGASAAGQAPSVTTYFAQVPLPTGDGGGPGRYFDLQNVQVLKGPQGTLFGRNSTGGAVLFEPQRPTGKLEGYIQSQFGNYADQEFEGALNVPLVDDTLAARLSAKTARRDGFTHDVSNDTWLDDRDYQSTRLSLLFTPNDNFENLLIADYFTSNVRGGSNVIAGIDNQHVLAADVVRIPGSPIPLRIAGPVTIGQLRAAAAPGAVIGAALAAGGLGLLPSSVTDGAIADQAALGKRKVKSDTHNLNEVTAWGIADIAQFNFSDSLTFKNIIGYRRYEQHLAYDLDGSELPLLNQTRAGNPTASIEQISEEPQLQGTAFDEKLDWTVGGFALTVRTPDTQHTTLTGFGSPTERITDTKATSRSLYGQGTYDLGDFVDGLNFTLGYRYTKDHRELEQTSLTNGVCTLPAGDPNTDFARCLFTQEKDFGSSSYTLGLDYQVTPDTLLYIANRKGYRSGGLNTGGAQLGQSAYGPEDVTDIEAGIKADWHFSSGISARTNLAIYRTKRDDAQVSESFTTVTNGQSQAISLIVNEANATIKGIEFDGQLAFTNGLELSGSYAYTEAQYDTYFDIPTNRELTNQPYPFSPRNKLNLNARYHLPLDASLGEISVSTNWSRSSAVNFNVTPDPYGKQEAYSQVDAFVNWAGVLDSNFDATLFVTNLTDQTYKIGGLPIYNAVGFTSVIYNEPRMWGVSAKYTFGRAP